MTTPNGFAGRFALATMLSLTLSACDLTMVTSAHSACSVWGPVHWSREDTDETIRQVRINNARHDAYCGRNR